MKTLPTVTFYFLGANSKDGFYSLYDQFTCGPKDILHIIKSGPGTGKSTFMKQIGKAAEAHGFDVEYILCSGDPTSLDGVYIPSLHVGWADGTAPHILEPKHFGIDGNYINLGQFCQLDNLYENQEKIKHLTAAYRFYYQKAYMYLHAAGSLQTILSRIPNDGEERIRTRARAKAKKELSNIENTSHRPTKRFLSAISYIGNHILADTLHTLCDRICVVESGLGLERLYFEELLCEANNRGVYYIECPNPLSPEHTEAILFPSLRLGFAVPQIASQYKGLARTIHLDSHVEIEEKAEHRQNQKLKQQLLDAAYAQLSLAKHYHDKLEEYYRPALDVDALNQYTATVIEHLFK